MTRLSRHVYILNTTSMGSYLDTGIGCETEDGLDVSDFLYDL
jgi:hypothetical protein